MSKFIKELLVFRSPVCIQNRLYNCLQKNNLYANYIVNADTNKCNNEHCRSHSLPPRLLDSLYTTTTSMLMPSCSNNNEKLLKSVNPCGTNTCAYEQFDTKMCHSKDTMRRHKRTRAFSFKTMQKRPFSKMSQRKKNSIKYIVVNNNKGVFETYCIEAKKQFEKAIQSSSQETFHLMNKSIYNKDKEDEVVGFSINPNKKMEVIRYQIDSTPAYHKSRRRTKPGVYYGTRSKKNTTSEKEVRKKKSSIVTCMRDVYLKKKYHNRTYSTYNNQDIPQSNVLTCKKATENNQNNDLSHDTISEKMFNPVIRPNKTENTTNYNNVADLIGGITSKFCQMNQGFIRRNFSSDDRDSCYSCEKLGGVKLSEEDKFCAMCELFNENEEECEEEIEEMKPCWLPKNPCSNKKKKDPCLITSDCGKVVSKPNKLKMLASRSACSLKEAPDEYNPKPIEPLIKAQPLPNLERTSRKFPAEPYVPRRIKNLPQDRKPTGKSPDCAACTKIEPIEMDFSLPPTDLNRKISCPCIPDNIVSGLPKKIKNTEGPPKEKSTKDEPIKTTTTKTKEQSSQAKKDCVTPEINHSGIKKYSTDCSEKRDKSCPKKKQNDEEVDVDSGPVYKKHTKWVPVKIETVRRQMLKVAAAAKKKQVSKSPLEPEKVDRAQSLWSSIKCPPNLRAELPKIERKNHEVLAGISDIIKSIAIVFGKSRKVQKEYEKEDKPKPKKLLKCRNNRKTSEVLKCRKNNYHTMPRHLEYYKQIGQYLELQTSSNSNTPEFGKNKTFRAHFSSSNTKDQQKSGESQNAQLITDKSCKKDKKGDECKKITSEDCKKKSSDEEFRKMCKKYEISVDVDDKKKGSKNCNSSGKKCFSTTSIQHSKLDSNLIATNNKNNNNFFSSNNLNFSTLRNIDYKPVKKKSSKDMFMLENRVEKKLNIKGYSSIVYLDEEKDCSPLKVYCHKSTVILKDTDIFKKKYSCSVLSKIPNLKDCEVVCESVKPENSDICQIKDPVYIKSKKKLNSASNSTTPKAPIGFDIIFMLREFPPAPPAPSAPSALSNECDSSVKDTICKKDTKTCDTPKLDKKPIKEIKSVDTDDVSSKKELPPCLEDMLPQLKTKNKKSFQESKNEDLSDSTQDPGYPDAYLKMCDLFENSKQKKVCDDTVSSKVPTKTTKQTKDVYPDTFNEICLKLEGRKLDYPQAHTRLCKQFEIESKPQDAVEKTFNKFDTLPLCNEKQFKQSRRKLEVEKVEPLDEEQEETKQTQNVAEDKINYPETLNDICLELEGKKQEFPGYFIKLCNQFETTKSVDTVGEKNKFTKSQICDDSKLKQESKKLEETVKQTKKQLTICMESEGRKQEYSQAYLKLCKLFDAEDLNLQPPQTAKEQPSKKCKEVKKDCDIKTSTKQTKTDIEEGAEYPDRFNKICMEFDGKKEEEFSQSYLKLCKKFDSVNIRENMKSPRSEKVKCPQLNKNKKFKSKESMYQQPKKTQSEVKDEIVYPDMFYEMCMKLEGKHQEYPPSYYRICKHLEATQRQKDPQLTEKICIAKPTTQNKHGVADKACMKVKSENRSKTDVSSKCKKLSTSKKCTNLKKEKDTDVYDSDYPSNFQKICNQFDTENDSKSFNLLSCHLVTIPYNIKQKYDDYGKDINVDELNKQCKNMTGSLSKEDTNYPQDMLKKSEKIAKCKEEPTTKVSECKKEIKVQNIAALDKKEKSDSEPDYPEQFLKLCGQYDSRYKSKKQDGYPTAFNKICRKFEGESESKITAKETCKPKVAKCETSPSKPPSNLGESYGYPQDFAEICNKLATQTSSKKECKRQQNKSKENEITRMNSPCKSQQSKSKQNEITRMNSPKSTRSGSTCTQEKRFDYDLYSDQFNEICAAISGDIIKKHLYPKEFREICKYFLDDNKQSTSGSSTCNNKKPFCSRKAPPKKQSKSIDKKIECSNKQTDQHDESSYPQQFNDIYAETSGIKDNHQYPREFREIKKQFEAKKSSSRNCSSKKPNSRNYSSSVTFDISEQDNKFTYNYPQKVTNFHTPRYTISDKLENQCITREKNLYKLLLNERIHTTAVNYLCAETPSSTSRFRLDCSEKQSDYTKYVFRRKICYTKQCIPIREGKYFSSTQVSLNKPNSRSYSSFITPGISDGNTKRNKQYSMCWSLDKLKINQHEANLNIFQRNLNGCSNLVLSLSAGNLVLRNLSYDCRDKNKQSSSDFDDSVYPQEFNDIYAEVKGKKSNHQYPRQYRNIVDKIENPKRRSTPKKCCSDKCNSLSDFGERDSKANQQELATSRTVSIDDILQILNNEIDNNHLFVIEEKLNKKLLIHKLPVQFDYSNSKRNEKENSGWSLESICARDSSNKKSDTNLVLSNEYDNSESKENISITSKVAKVNIIGENFKLTQLSETKSNTRPYCSFSSKDESIYPVEYKKIADKISGVKSNDDCYSENQYPKEFEEMLLKMSGKGVNNPNFEACVNEELKNEDFKETQVPEEICTEKIIQKMKEERLCSDNKYNDLKKEKLTSHNINKNEDECNEVVLYPKPTKPRKHKLLEKCQVRITSPVKINSDKLEKNQRVCLTKTETLSKVIKRLDCDPPQKPFHCGDDVKKVNIKKDCIKEEFDCEHAHSHLGERSFFKKCLEVCANLEPKEPLECRPVKGSSVPLPQENYITKLTCSDTKKRVVDTIEEIKCKIRQVLYRNRDKASPCLETQQEHATGKTNVNVMASLESCEDLDAQSSDETIRTLQYVMMKKPSVTNCNENEREEEEEEEEEDKEKNDGHANYKNKLVCENLDKNVKNKKHLEAVKHRKLYVSKNITSKLKAKKNRSKSKQSNINKITCKGLDPCKEETVEGDEPCKEKINKPPNKQVNWNMYSNCSTDCGNNLGDKTNKSHEKQFNNNMYSNCGEDCGNENNSGNKSNLMKFSGNMYTECAKECDYTVHNFKETSTKCSSKNDPEEHELHECPREKSFRTEDDNEIKRSSYLKIICKPVSQNYVNKILKPIDRSKTSRPVNKCPKPTHGIKKFKFKYIPPPDLKDKYN